MKQVYNLAGLMRKLKVDSFSELQEHGYDVRSYLEQREQELADELEGPCDFFGANGALLER